jgi:hypothetical protein
MLKHWMNGIGSVLSMSQVAGLRALLLGILY